MGSRENFFGLVRQQNNNPKFQGWHIYCFTSTDHRGKKICAMFDLPIQNKGSAINVVKLHLKIVINLKT